jgi:hypothetical protein
MKLVIFYLALGMASNAFSAQHICENSDFRKDIDVNNEYCIAEPYKRDGKTKYRYKMNEKTLGDLAAVTNKSAKDLFYNDKFWCGSDCQEGLIQNFKDQVATKNLGLQSNTKNANRFTELVTTVDDTQVALKNVETKLEVANAALDVSPEAVYAEFAGKTKSNIPYNKLMSPRCSQDPDCLKTFEEFGKYDTKRTAKIAGDRDFAAKEIRQSGATLDRIAKDIDKSYGNGEFKKIALKKLVKSDPSLKGQLRDPNSSIEALCKERSSKDKASRTKADSSVISTCDQIKDEAGRISSLRDNISNLKDDIRNSSGLDFLSLKLNLKGLTAEERIAALSGISEDSKSKLKGTILGHMMDQLREDMCTVANNPGSMCTGTAFNTKEFVNDGTDVSNKFYDSRSISSQPKKSSSSATAE